MPNWIGLADLRPAIFVGMMALAGLFAGGALAQSEIIDGDFGDECNSVNCSATEIAGWVGSSSAQVLPWTAKFLAVAGACLRLDVSSITVAAADLKMVVVAPNGVTRYRKDNGGPGCANCPLVKIDPAPVTGFYTAIISSSNGAAVDSDFHLLFGQYPHANVNCSQPTQPVP